MVYNKGIESNNIHHGSNVSKVTIYVEELVKDGNYAKASLILQKFNEQYPMIKWNSEELAQLVDDLLKEQKSEQ